ncbi:MAG: class C sortase [Oscillospiraceae bacterium]|nr:class C sortase [Oscillospiraceae bacterium]
MKKKAIMISLAAVIFLLALGMTLYPLISNRYNEKHHSEIHTAYSEQVEQADNSEIVAAKELAIAYNKAIQPGVQAAEAFSSEALQFAAKDYASLLNLTGNGIMGYVRIPKLNVDLPIYHGTADATLEIGIGHLLGSSLPVGGESTHTVLTGHSGLASQKMFSDLVDLEIGDVFYLDVLDETLAYQVDQIKTVLPYDSTYLGIETGGDYCTLVTCTPFGVNTHRLLVRGTRIPYEEEKEIMVEAEQTEQTVSNWEQQYKKGLLLGLCLAVVIVAVVLVISFIRRRIKRGPGGKYEQ